MCAHGCPCGARGVAGATCSCSAQRLQQHRERLSRALLDRFDLALTMPRPRGSELAAPPGEPSGPVRDRVGAARARLAATQPPLSDAAAGLLTRAVERLPLSGRGRARVASVAATIAALSAEEVVGADHLAEALSYRPPQELVT
ncbi:MAG TPA: ATP-binding protein [Gaiellaceae bacterium]